MGWRVQSLAFEEAYGDVFLKGASVPTMSRLVQMARLGSARRSPESSCTDLNPWTFLERAWKWNMGHTTNHKQTTGTTNRRISKTEPPPDQVLFHLAVFVGGRAW